MAQKMVTKFRRSLSFPNQCSSSAANSKCKKASYHVRSVSLPCRPSSHPLISQLRDQVNELKSSWAESSSPSPSAAWICDGLNQLKSVQESLDDLLQLPTTRESIYMSSFSSSSSCCGSSRGLIDKFLDDLLRVLDAYGLFQTLVLTLKEQHSAAQVALKRRDYFKLITSCSKNFNKMAKDFRRLSSSVQPPSSRKSGGRRGAALMMAGVVQEEDDDGDEIVEVIKDVIEVTALVSFALFNGLAVSLSSHRKPLPITSSRCLMTNFSMKKNHMRQQQQQQQQQQGIEEFEEIISSLEGLGKNVHQNNNHHHHQGEEEEEEELKRVCKRMKELEDCIHGIENASERVLRSLFNTRVCLLNVLTAL